MFGFMQRGSRAVRGFSLVELVIVVVIIAIVAAIAVPRLGSMAARAQLGSAIAAVRSLETKIEEVVAVEGTYPAKIDPDWFPSGRLPSNPFAQTAGVEVDAAGNARHPATVTLDGNEGYWYNPDNGVIRARVPKQATPAATAALYRQVNGLTANNDFTRGTVSIIDATDIGAKAAEASGGGLDNVLRRNP